MNSSSRLFEIENLHVSLGSRPVLRGIDGALHAGRITGIVGPNGAGKSTLLRALAGLVQPRAGNVWFDGAPIADWQRSDIARRLAYLPQERHVHWPMAVRAVVALGRLPHRTVAAGESSADRTAIEAAMHAMDVEPMAARAVSQLSGGERARVLLARALAVEADVLLADEPTTGLDPAHQFALFDQFTKLSAVGRTVVIALHDLSLALRFCDDILVLKDGLALAAGTAGDVLTAGLLADAYGIRAQIAQVDGVPVIIPLGGV